MEDIKDKIEKEKLGRIVENVSLMKYTTYKVGGMAAAFFYPNSVESLVKALKIIKSHNVPFKILGNGSNVLFSDKPYSGIIIKLDELNKLDITGTKVVVGAGFPLPRLAMLTAKKDLTGLEFAAGIPGSIGGAVFMNAGAYKSDMGYVVREVKVLTPELKVIKLSNAELDFHYRHSFLQDHPDYICLEATLRLKKGKREAIEKVIKERRERRMESQPLEYPSCGSVFRNPEGMFVGAMIEDLGLKGLTKGGAQISKKHANFIINIGGATAQDIKDLIEFAQEAVYENYHIRLKVEQEFVNWE